MSFLSLTSDVDLFFRFKVSNCSGEFCQYSEPISTSHKQSDFGNIRTNHFLFYSIKKEGKGKIVRTENKYITHTGSSFNAFLQHCFAAYQISFFFFLFLCQGESGSCIMINGRGK